MPAANTGQPRPGSLSDRSDAAGVVHDVDKNLLANNTKSPFAPPASLSPLKGYELDQRVDSHPLSPGASSDGFGLLDSATLLNCLDSDNEVFDLDPRGTITTSQNRSRFSKGQKQSGAKPGYKHQEDKDFPQVPATPELVKSPARAKAGAAASGEMRRGQLAGRARGPPAMLPGQCSPEMQDVLIRWTRVYEEQDPKALKAVCEDVYSEQVTFEDPMFATAGREGAYRQFAALKKITSATQVEILSVTVEQVPSSILPAARGVRRVRLTNIQHYWFPLPWYLRPAKLLGFKDEMKVSLCVTSVLVVAHKITPLGTRATASVATAKAAVAAATTSEGAAEGPTFPAPEAAAPEPAPGAVLEVLYHLDTWNNLPLLWRTVRQIAGLVTDVILSRVFWIN